MMNNIIVRSYFYVDVVSCYMCLLSFFFFFFFFFNDTATTEIYTLSLHDALPICGRSAGEGEIGYGRDDGGAEERCRRADRKSTRLNSSHSQISYAVFCLKKKKKKKRKQRNKSNIKRTV